MSKAPGYIFFLLLLLCCITNSSQLSEDVYDEELFVKQLESGHLYTYFQFTTKWDVNQSDPSQLQHYKLFPRQLGEIVEKFQVRELHLCLTQGLWRTHKWGYPYRHCGSGAEVSAWFQPQLNSSQVDEKWLGFVNALSGLLCASLNFISQGNTLSPRWSFLPEGVSGKLFSNNNSHSRYASLPREIVCTENLTPWKKLLPCNSQSGLVQLLNSKQVYDSNYHSLSVDLRPICRDKKCTKTSLELKLSLSLVTEPIVRNVNSNNKNKQKADWSFRSTFGSALFSTCKAARSSLIYVDVTSNATGSANWTLQPEPSRRVLNKRGGSSQHLAVYDLKRMSQEKPLALNIRATHENKWIYGIVPPPVLHATRFVGGRGQEKGKLVTRISNNYLSGEIEVVYLELIPWYCRVLSHTLSITNTRTGTKITPRKQYFLPGLDRKRPHHLELRLNLPPNSVTEVQFEFEKAFLKWTEYPPDAHRGFDLGPAVISALLPSARNVSSIPVSVSTIAESWNVSQPNYFVRIYTEPLVVTMATPDFSMPYNVICLACTVVALAFGPLHNLTTKRLVLKEESEDEGLVKKIFKFLKTKKTTTNESEKTKDGDETEEKTKIAS